MKNKEKKKLNDKLRTPYNIWINVIGFIIFILIASIGTLVLSIGFYADQRAVLSEDRCEHHEWCKYKYTYDYDIPTRSDWRDSICRVLMGVIGIAIIELGIICWAEYSFEHYWHSNECC